MARTIAQSRFDPTALIVTVVCLSGFLISLTLLYRDLRATGQAGSEGRAGVIEDRLSDVQRRVATSFLWNYAEQGEVLYYGDAVRVGQKGAAVLKLDRGTTLELGENSLVVLEDWKDLPLHVLEGSSIVRGADGDTEIVASRAGEARIQRYEARLLEPKPFTRWHVSDDEPRPVKFRWASQHIAQSDAALHLQIATHRSFQGRRIVDREVRADEITLPIPPGVYYWRLARGKTPASETRELAVRRVWPLQPVSPVGDSMQTLVDKESTLLMRWAHPAEVYHGRYTLLLARDPELKGVLRSMAIDPARESIRLSELAPGRYYWRLQSHFPDRKVDGPTESFQVAYLPKLEVRLLSPADGAAAEIRQPIPMHWESNGADPEFQVQWEDRSDHSGHKLTGHNDRWSWQAPTAGTYRWRVAARHAGREAISPWRTMHVFSGDPLITRAPAGDARLESWQAPALHFAWDAGEPSSSRYRIEYATDLELKNNLVSREVTGTTWDAGVFTARGTWFWRVTQLDRAGSPIRVSAIQRFHAVLPPLLPAPAAMHPSDGAVLEPVHRDRGARLTWGTVAAAAAYEVVVTRDGRVVWRSSTKETSLPLPRLLPGRYHWSISARDPAGRLGAVADHELSIEFGHTLPAPGAATAVELR